jgi:hypothetical protein
MSGIEEQPTPVTSGLTRRNVLKGAAWAAPVVAFAAAAPLASASPTTASHFVSGALRQTSGIGAFTVYDDAASKYTIVDNGAKPWSTGTLTVTFGFALGSLSGTFYNNESGTPVGPLAVSSTVTASDGGIWTVTSVSSTQVILTASAVTISSATTDIEFPALYASGTYSGQPYASLQMGLANLPGQADGFITFLNYNPPA